MTDEHAQYYIDVRESALNEEAQNLLDGLKNDIVLHHLSDSNIKQYDVEWRSQGIDPEHCENHKVFNNYLQFLSLNFLLSIKQ